MKPTKMRNKQIYQATNTMRSRQLGAALSADLRKKHEKRSIRVVVGDTVKVTRGEYKDVEGKVSTVNLLAGRISVEGVKKEKGKGEKFDVLIHASNVVVTALKTDDPWRTKKLKGVIVKPTPSTTEATSPKTSTPETSKPEASTPKQKTSTPEASKPKTPKPKTEAES